MHQLINLRVELTLMLLQVKILSMLNYAICEIGGKQYKVIPDKSLEVSIQPTDKDIEVNVLLLSDGDKLNLGNPYLKEKLMLKIIEQTRGAKIRVSKFHAKANYRRTVGFRSKLTKVILPVKKAS